MRLRRGAPLGGSGGAPAIAGCIAIERSSGSPAAPAVPGSASSSACASAAAACCAAAGAAARARAAAAAAAEAILELGERDEELVGARVEVLEAEGVEGLEVLVVHPRDDPRAQQVDG